MTELEELFAPLGLTVPEILLPAPRVSPVKFAVIACDQHSAEPDYWQETERMVGDAPSALRMILPEAWLDKPDRPTEDELNGSMAKYLEDGTLQSMGQGFVYVRRRTQSGVRHGLVAAIDLEQYDYTPGNKSLIRATEATVKERLPARIRIRQRAPLELPHVMVLTNDRFNDVTYLLEASLGRLEKLYDFPLMQGGGQLTGYRVSDTVLLRDIAAILHRLKADSEDGLLFAVGDGNHSLAAAKECWNEKKQGLTQEERANHPMRFALAELVSIYDDAMVFHPIHRLLYHVDPEQLQQKLGFDANNPPSLQELQPRLDAWLAENPKAEIEYIHGSKECLELAAQTPDRLAIVYESFPKDGFFDTVVSHGIFVRKSFSIGSANEKRYYFESRRLQ